MFKRASAGPKVKIRKHQEDPEGSPGAKMVKNVVRYALLQGSKEGSGEAKVRIALTLQRFGGSRAKMMKKHWFLKVLEGPQEGRKATTTKNTFWWVCVLRESECHFENAKHEKCCFMKRKWPAGK